MLKYDRSYVAGDFAIQLGQRPDVNEKLVAAFESLIGLIGKEPDFGKSTPSLMEAGLLSCPNSDLEIAGSDATSDNHDSERSFNDAVEQL